MPLPFLMKLILPLVLSAMFPEKVAGLLLLLFPTEIARVERAVEKFAITTPDPVSEFMAKVEPEMPPFEMLMPIEPLGTPAPNSSVPLTTRLASGKPTAGR